MSSENNSKQSNLSDGEEEVDNNQEVNLEERNTLDDNDGEETERTIEVDSVVTDLDTLEALRTETLQDKEFSNPVSKRYGVEIDPEMLTEERFENTLTVDSYPLTEYSYENEDGETIHLAEVYILFNKRNREFIYYLDEPKLASGRAGTDDPDEEVMSTEMKWYNRIKSDFDSIISNIDKDEFAAQAVSEVNKTDDIDYVINKILQDEFAWNRFKNKFIKAVYNNILRDVVDMIESLPEKDEAMYEELPRETQMKIRYYLQKEYLEFGKISPMFNDPYIEEINCNGPNEPVQVYHSEYDENLITNHAYEEDELRNTVNMLANESGEQLNTSNPSADGSLPDGSRINLTLAKEDSGIATKGDNFTIRVFDEVPLTPIDLINYDTISIDQMVWLWLAVQYGNSGIIAGGTASGKTTTLNGISTFTEPSNKIVTIEDTQELVIHADNFIQGITRESVSSDESYNIGMMKLVKAALRQRPDYLIIGEVRDEAARPMFQAMATGHTSYTTFHADDITELKNRLTGQPINIGTPMLKSLDFVLNQDKVQERRVLKELREIEEVEDDQLKSDVVTGFDYESRTFNDIKWIESNIMDDVRLRNGWNKSELKEEINKRKKLLNYMSNNMPRGSEHDIEEQQKRSKKITKIIKLYMRNPDAVMQLMETDLMLKDDINTYLDIFIAQKETENLANRLKENNIKTYKKIFDAQENVANLAKTINKQQEKMNEENNNENDTNEQ